MKIPVGIITVKSGITTVLGSCIELFLRIFQAVMCINTLEKGTPATACCSMTGVLLKLRHAGDGPTVCLGGAICRNKGKRNGASRALKKEMMNWLWGSWGLRWVGVSIHAERSRLPWSQRTHAVQKPITSHVHKAKKKKKSLYKAISAYCYCLDQPVNMSAAWGLLSPGGMRTSQIVCRTQIRIEMKLQSCW